MPIFASEKRGLNFNKLRELDILMWVNLVGKWIINSYQKAKFHRNTDLRDCYEQATRQVTDVIGMYLIVTNSCILLASAPKHKQWNQAVVVPA